jgi:outer membrane protein assembly factor BamB
LRALRRCALLLTLGSSLLFLIVSPAAAPALAAAGTWSQYQGGASHTGTVATGPAAPYRNVWTASQTTGGPRGAYGLSPPILAEGLAIAVGPDYVVAVDASSGTPAWRIDRTLGPSVAPAFAPVKGRELLLFTEGWGTGPPDASATASPSPTTTTPAVVATATPSVATPSLATPSASRASGQRSPSAGAVTPTASPSASSTPPAAVDSHLVAVDVGDQQRVWSLALPEVSRTGVTVDGTTAFVGTIDGTVTAVDIASGNVRWASATGAPFLDQPIAAGDDLALVSAQGDRSVRASVVGLRVSDGSEAWRYQPVTTATVVGPASVGNGVGFVSLTDATIRSFDLSTGAERWSSRLNSIVFLGGPPVVVANGVIVSDAGGQLYRLDATTGDRVWDFALNESVLRTAPIAIGDTVLLGTQAGAMDAFDLGTGDLVWRGPAGDGPVRGLAASETALVAVRAGNGTGLEGFANDPSATLIREPSPTIVDAARLASAWALAAVPLVVVVLLLGRLLWPRLGPVVFHESPAPARDGDGAAGEDRLPGDEVEP